MKWSTIQPSTLKPHQISLRAVNRSAQFNNVDVEAHALPTDARAISTAKVPTDAKVIAAAADAGEDVEAHAVPTDARAISTPKVPTDAKVIFEAADAGEDVEAHAVPTDTRAISTAKVPTDAKVIFEAAVLPMLLVKMLKRMLCRRCPGHINP